MLIKTLSRLAVWLSPLTELEVGDVALDSGAGAGASGHLHAVAHPGGQAGDQHGQRGAVHCAVDVVLALVAQAPDLKGGGGGHGERQMGFRY